MEVGPDRFQMSEAVACRLRQPRQGIFASVLILQFLFSGAPRCSADHNPVQPGDTGTIELAVENLSDGDSYPIEDLRIAVTVPDARYRPYFLINQGESNFGPLNISTGQIGTFIVNYTIGPDAPVNLEGNFTVMLKVDPPSYKGLQDDPAALDVSVLFVLDTGNSDRGGILDEVGREISGGVITSTNTARIWGANDGAGVCKMQLFGANASFPEMRIPGPPPNNQYAETVGYRGLSSGEYTATVTYCAGRQRSWNFTVVPGTWYGTGSLTANGAVLRESFATVDMLKLTEDLLHFKVSVQSDNPNLLNSSQFVVNIGGKVIYPV